MWNPWTAWQARWHTRSQRAGNRERRLAGCQRASRLERLEARWPLDASLDADLTEEPPEPTALIFEPAFPDRDLEVARLEQHVEEDQVGRFSLRVDDSKAFTLYISGSESWRRYFGTLIDAEGNTVEHRWWQGAELVHFTVPESGDYTLEIAFPANGSTLHQVRVLQGSVPFESAVAPTSIQPLPSDAPGIAQASAAGVIRSALENDRFAIGPIAAGALLDITVAMPTSGTVAPIIELHGPHGVVQDTDIALNRIQSVTTVSGEYEIRVRHNTIVGDTRYVVVPHVTRDAAKQQADDLGGHLLAINSLEEQTLIESLVSESWLGVERAPGEPVASLRWGNGDPLTYSNWREGHPESQGVGWIDTNGSWNLSDRWHYRYRTAVLEVPRTTADPASSLAGPDGLYALNIVVTDAASPQVVSLGNIPSHDLVADSLVSQVSVTFSEPIRHDIAFDDAIDVRGSGEDAIFFTDDDRVFLTESTLTKNDFQNTLSVRIVDGPMADGVYRLTVGDQVTDLFGNSLADGAGFNKTFRVAAVGDEHVFEGLNNDTLETATPLPITVDSNNTGLSHTTMTGLGMLETHDDEDHWTFEVAPHTEVAVRVSGDGSPLLALLDENGNELASRRGFLDPVHVIDGGKLYLRVYQGYPSADDLTYRLSVDTSSDVALEPRTLQSAWSNAPDALTFGPAMNPRTAQIAGALSHPHDMQSDRFSLGILSAGSTISMQSILPHWSTLKPFVELEGSAEALDVDVSEERFYGTVLADGEYFAVIRAENGVGVHGQYVLDVAIDDTNAPRLVSVQGLPKASEIGEEMIGRVGLTFNEDVLVEDQSLELREAGPDGQFDTADDQLRPVELVSNLSGQTEFVLPNGPIHTGRFRLSVSPDVSDRSGNRVDLENTAPLVFELHALASNQVVETSFNDEQEAATDLSFETDPNGTGWSRTARNGVGTLATITDVDWWQFEAEAGEGVRVTLTSHEDSHVTLQLFDSQGHRISNSSVHQSFSDRRNGVETEVVGFDVVEDGTYRIEVASSRHALHDPSDWLNAQRNYEVQVDRVAGVRIERREIDNGHFRSDAIELVRETTGEQAGTLSGAIAGTLLSGDVDTFQLSILKPDLQVSFVLDRPAWSHAEPVIHLVGPDRSVTKLMPDEGGVYQAITTDAGRYEVRVAADSEDTGAGSTGQYVLHAAITSAIPLNVTEVRGLPEDGGHATQMLSEFEVSFSLELDEESLRDSELAVIEAGADGEFGTSDDQPFGLRHHFFRRNFGTTVYDHVHFSVASGVGVLRPGNYRLQLPATLTSQFGDSLGEGSGFSTSFSIGELPPHYRFENLSSNDVSGAVHLEPETHDSHWLTRGIGSLEHRSDVDHWSFDAHAGDWVTVWTPARVGYPMVSASLLDSSGELVFQDPVNTGHPRTSAFGQFAIEEDGRYVLGLGMLSLGLPNDRLYELWVHISPGIDGRPPVDDEELPHVVYVESNRGTVAVAAGQLRDPLDTRSWPPNQDSYLVDQVPVGTGIAAEVRSPSWSNATPTLSASHMNAEIQWDSTFTTTTLKGTRTNDHATELILRPRSFVVNDGPGHVGHTDYLLEIQTLDLLPPLVSVNAQSDGETDQVIVTAFDSNNPEYPNSGVTGLTLFSIENGTLKSLASEASDRFERTYANEDARQYFAVASDRIGNRSSIDLRDVGRPEINIDSTIANPLGATLPSRILVSADQQLSWSGDWQVLSPNVNVDRVMHRVEHRGQVIEFETALDYQNPVHPHDVDRSGDVSALDALLIINQLNRTDDNTPSHGNALGLYLDVNGDTHLSALDALHVINQLATNRRPSGQPLSHPLAPIGETPGDAHRSLSAGTQVAGAPAVTKPSRPTAAFPTTDLELTRPQTQSWIENEDTGMDPDSVDDVIRSLLTHPLHPG